MTTPRVGGSPSGVKVRRLDTRNVQIPLPESPKLC